jgi:hypothetical protein
MSDVKGRQFIFAEVRNLYHISRFIKNQSSVIPYEITNLSFLLVEEHPGLSSISTNIHLPFKCKDHPKSCAQLTVVSQNASCIN